MKVSYLAMVVLFVLILGVLKPQLCGVVSGASVSELALESSVPPAIEWNITYGDLGTQCARYLKQTSGGFVFAGPSGGFDTLIVHTDMDGNIIWNKTVGCQGAIRQTSDGGYIIGTGRMKAAGESLTVGTDAGLVKMYGDGKIEWNKTYGLEWYGSPCAVRQTGDGGYVMAGTFFNVTLMDACLYLVKIDLSGNLVWKKTYGDSLNGTPESVEETADGSFILVGSTWLEGAIWTDGWVVKIDKLGNVVWNATFGQPEWGDWIYSVQQTSDGGYIIGGLCDRDPYNQPPRGYFWLVKISSYGAMEWWGKYGDYFGEWAFCNSVSQTDDKGFIAVGRYGSKGWLIRTDETGKMIWNTTFEGSGEAVIQTADGGYAIAGASSWISPEDGTDMLLIKMMRANPPVVQFSYDVLTPSVQELITFNASFCYDLDQDIVAYSWDFDDGNISSISEPFISHAFELPDTYNVTLTVVDSHGLNSSYSQLIWVRIDTSISVSTSAASTLVGFRVNATGELRDASGNALKDEIVTIRSSRGGSTWTIVGEDNTDNLGRFFLSWTPSETGNYAVGVDWVGNQTFYPANNATNLEVLIIPTDISITLSSSTSLVGFTIEIRGNLTSYVGMLSNAPIYLTYSVTFGQTWNDITLTYTASDGSYLAVWMPSATGNYIVKATWAGNSTCRASSKTITLSVTPYKETDVFAVESNSTSISPLSYALSRACNSLPTKFSFNVAGETGTGGYVKATIAKSRVSNIADVKVYVDDTLTNHTITSSDDAWVIYFTYTHSVHSIAITFLVAPTPPSFFESLVGKILLCAILVIAVGILAIYVSRRKKRDEVSSEQSPKE